MIKVYKWTQGTTHTGVCVTHTSVLYTIGARGASCVTCMHIHDGRTNERTNADVRVLRARKAWIDIRVLPRYLRVLGPGTRRHRNNVESVSYSKSQTAIL